MKFRVWHKFTHCFLASDEFVITSKGQLLLLDEDGNVGAVVCWFPNTPNEYCIMQFTGLHDKNGEEIWEGDLLKEDFEDDTIEDSIWEVFWNNEQGAWWLKYNHGIDDDPIIANLYRMKVVGNIYENPELIK